MGVRHMRSGRLLLCLLCLVLVGCKSQSKKIDRVFESLPVPIGAELLYEQKGTSQGSQDSCFFTYEQRLYGTNQDFQEVSEFYSQAMEDGTWRRDTSEFVSRGAFAWQRNQEEYNLLVAPLPLMGFPEEVVASAKEKYRTPYYVSVTYADWIARKWCLKQQ